MASANGRCRFVADTGMEVGGQWNVVTAALRDVGLSSPNTSFFWLLSPALDLSEVCPGFEISQLVLC